MKIVANYLNLAFHVEVKAKSNHNFLNFVFHFIENTKWHFYLTLKIFEKKYREYRVRAMILLLNFTL